jgi:peptide/nickel transport system permease protein
VLPDGDSVARRGRDEVVIVRAVAVIARRLVQMVVVLVAVTWLAFLALALLPGNPAYIVLGPTATARAVAGVDRRLGLDKPLLTRYWIWIVHALHGNLGSSYLTGQSVVHTVAQHLPETLELIVTSQLIAYAIGVPLGIVAALHVGGKLDRVITTTALGMISLPTFVLGVVMVLLFAVKLHVFPATGYVPLGQSVTGNIRSMVLPSVTLAVGSAMIYTRVMRSGLVDTLRQPFILVARAKGMTRRRLVARHALRPSITSLITVSGINVGYLIGGAFIIEYIFQLPGIGLLTIQSIDSNDYLMVQGVVVLVAAGFIIVNALVDGLYLLVDPRVARGAGRR